MSMDDWDNLVEPTRDALEALLRKGDAMADRIEELEAKLAKAVDVDLIEQAVSDVLSEGGSYRDAAEYVARTTLAELKGQNDD
jgi:cell division septum initiation protein DivIVA